MPGGGTLGCSSTDGPRLHRTVQGRTLMRVAFLSHNAQAADAIGRQLAEKVAFFLDRGADVRVLLESARRLHSGLKPYVRRVTVDRLSPADRRFLDSADLIAVEYGQYYCLLDLLPLL